MAEIDNRVIAVNVALIPPGWVQERARHVNSILNQTQGAGGLQFDATHIPHVSLAQLFVMRDAIPFFIERISLVVRGSPALPLRVLGMVSRESTVFYLLDRTPEPASLHAAIMDGIQEWAEQSGSAAAFYEEGEAVRDKDVEWVTNYRANASYRKFIPHITLNVGTAESASTMPKEAPFDFTASEIGLFHLGRFCSCRVLLYSWRMA